MVIPGQDHHYLQPHWMTVQTFNGSSSILPQTTLQLLVYHNGQGFNLSAQDLYKQREDVGCLSLGLRMYYVGGWLFQCVSFSFSLLWRTRSQLESFFSQSTLRSTPRFPVNNSNIVVRVSPLLNSSFPKPSPLAAADPSAFPPIYPSPAYGWSDCGDSYVSRPQRFNVAPILVGASSRSLSTQSLDPTQESGFDSSAVSVVPSCLWTQTLLQSIVSSCEARRQIA